MNQRSNEDENFHTLVELLQTFHMSFLHPYYISRHIILLYFKYKLVLKVVFTLEPFRKNEEIHV